MASQIVWHAAFRRLSDLTDTLSISTPSRRCYVPPQVALDSTQETRDLICCYYEPHLFTSFTKRDSQSTARAASSTPTPSWTCSSFAASLAQLGSKPPEACSCSGSHTLSHRRTPSNQIRGRGVYIRFGRSSDAVLQCCSAHIPLLFPPLP
jgi:hypothetical protein